MPCTSLSSTRPPGRSPSRRSLLPFCRLRRQWKLRGRRKEQEEKQKKHWARSSRVDDILTASDGDVERMCAQFSYFGVVIDADNDDAGDADGVMSDGVQRS
mmetsp:Transcript_102224/g.317980  ORF Transcript_102224/g.317980 Transcript_102224/m.317980 type:complete len:101 (+) Transcript_102224:789-1091(+)